MKQPSVLRIGLRIITIFLSGLFLYGMCFGVLMLADDDYDDVSEKDLIRWCDNDYYARDYDRLYETLNLYDLSDKRYDKYWDLINAYIYYENYLMWEKAAAAGLENAAEHMEMYYDLLTRSAEACEYPLHKGTIEDFLGELNRKR